MPKNLILLADQRYAAAVPHVPATHTPPTGRLLDTRARALGDLRISVTDRCNFRCGYCMPREVFDSRYPFLAHDALLSFEEIARTARLFVAHGVKKIRLTGGEPLLRKNLDALVGMLSALHTADGAELDLTLTTNGSLLARQAEALQQAGLKRVTISLDALDDALFRRMNDADFAVADVLAGVDAALRAGLSPVKLNMVVQRGINDQEIVPMARHVREHYGPAVTLRFIEYMDVGATNGWRMEQVLPSGQVIQRLNTAFGVARIDAADTSDTAERWRYTDGLGEVGMISSVTQAFCGSCTRARLSTEGKLFMCLFATQGQDLRALLRGDYNDEQISSAIAHIWRQRADRYSELRHTAQPEPRLKRIEMHYIGG